MLKCVILIIIVEKEKYYRIKIKYLFTYYNFSSSLLSYCFMIINAVSNGSWGWSGSAKVLGKLPVRGFLLIWIIVGQGPIAFAVGACGGCSDIFSLIYHFSFLSPSLGDGPI